MELSLLNNVDLPLHSLAKFVFFGLISLACDDGSGVHFFDRSVLLVFCLSVETNQLFIIEKKFITVATIELTHSLTQLKNVVNILVFSFE